MHALFSSSRHRASNVVQMHLGDGVDPDQSQQQTVFQHKALKLAVALFDSLQQLGRDWRFVLTFKRNDINIVYGQTRGLFAHNLLVDQETVAGCEQLFQAVNLFFPQEERLAIQLQSIYSEKVRSKVGLLRSPALKEEKIKRFDYNFSMVKESLVLGGFLYNQIHDRVYPRVEDIWRACQAWRVGRLDARTSADEIKNFVWPRIASSDSVYDYFTPISKYDKRYGYLLDVVRQKAIQTATNIRLVSSDGAFMQKKVASPNGQVFTVLSLQHRLHLDSGDIPLTMLRMTLNEQGRPIRSAWAHADNANCDISDKAHFKFNTMNLDEGLMVHTSQLFMTPLRQIIQQRLDDYMFRFVETKPLRKVGGPPLRMPDLHQREDVALLCRLGEIHYLLAQTIFDLRGSSAKSELFIRSLAVASGVELPPFKRGFVPDLESFVLSIDEFVKNYSGSFEFPL